MNATFTAFRCALCAALLLLTSLHSKAAITGQWDFNNGNLAATIGQDITYLDAETSANTRFGTTTALGIPDIDGQVASVMKFPKTAAELGGYYVPHGANANGGGFYLNRYTVIMDVLFPTASMNKARALFRSDLGFSPNADFFVNAGNSIGVDGGVFGGAIRADTWHRLAFAVDLEATPPHVSFFIDGVKVGTQNLSGIDTRWSSSSAFYFFYDDNDETELGYINSLQINDTKLTDGLIGVLGGAKADGILIGEPPNPYIESVSPSPETARVPGRSTVPPKPQITIVVQDGVATLVESSVQLKVDNVAVTPVISKQGKTTTITYTSTEFLQPLSIHTVNLSFQDTATPPNMLGTQWQFAVGDYISLDATAAAPLGSGNTPGFTVRTVQAPTEANIPNVNSFTRAVRQLNGTLTDGNGALVPNVAVAGTNPDGSYDVDVINFELSGAPFGVFQDTDVNFPGIPGTEDGRDVFATEVITYLELTEGVHRLAVSVCTDRTDTGTDDGFTLFDGRESRNFLAPVVGRFARGNVPAFSASFNTNVFTIVAPASGVYSMRLVHYQTFQNASLEWYSITDDGDAVLINDLSNPKAIKAFRNSTGALANKPYLADVRPPPGVAGVSPSAPIELLIIDGATQVDTSSIQLFLNGTLVPHTATKTGNRTTIIYRPNVTRTNPNNAFRLVYRDNSAPTPVTIENTWDFQSTISTSVENKVTGQWDFYKGDLSATVGKALQYLDGAAGASATKTQYGKATAFGLPLLNGKDVSVMQVPGDLDRNIGYIMDHGIAPNGGGTRVNQYTIIFDIVVNNAGPGAASLLQISSTSNQDDGDLFWQGNQFGQGGGGYNGSGAFTTLQWHRVVAAYDMAANPPVVTKYVDGIKQDDWTANQGLDNPRRALLPTAVLFGDGDQDERRVMWVSSVQIREGKLSDAQIVALGGPSSDKIPFDIPPSSVTGQWDFDVNNGALNGMLAPTVGKPLQYLDGAAGTTASKTQFGSASSFGLPLINGEDPKVMQVPGDLDRNIGYIMDHLIAPNGGGTRVNQYTIVYDIVVNNAGPGAASLLQISSVSNQDDGDLFWQGNQFGQGGGGYNGNGAFTTLQWHRVVAAYDMAATPPVVTKYVDGIKQDDWTANQGLDNPRRALLPTAVLFGDGDQDERRVMWVNSVQIRAGKLTDAQIVALGGPSAKGIPVAIPATSVTGQWDFDVNNGALNGMLAPTVGKPLQYLDGAAGTTAAKTQFGSASSFGIPLINGEDPKVMQVPGDLDRNIGYIMEHLIAPNGGGTRVNQYTIVMDVMVNNAGPGAASLLQISSTSNQDDGDLFWQGNQFGQGGGGYNGNGAFTALQWHRVVAAYDMAATPPVVTKYVDGIKQDDWTANQGLDNPRRALLPTAVLFGDGDQDERRIMWVNSVQIRAGKLSDAEIVLLGGPSARGIPVAVPRTTVTGQWDFDVANNALNGLLAPTIGKPLQYLDGAAGSTATKTQFGSASSFGLPLINGQDPKVMQVPGDLDRNIGYIMEHLIPPNGGGTRVNQYTLIMDIVVNNAGPGAASLLQISSVSNQDDGDLFWQGNQFGQGGGGYNGTGAFTTMQWHRIVASYNMAANPPVVTKYVDGIFQDDWTANQSLDNPRRALLPTAVLFGDGDQDERRIMWVSSVQIRSAPLTKAEMEALGGASANGIPVVIATQAPPPPAPIDITEISVSGATVTVRWSGGRGPFQLQKKASLNDANWQNIGAPTTDPSATDNITGTSGFYRVQGVP
ncbi:MAG: hypothetical protein AB1813_13930 [Verrucomicrobiota bacterium]